MIERRLARRRHGRQGKGSAETSGHIGSSKKEQDETEPGIKYETQNERGKNHKADHLRLHQRELESPVDETSDFLGPFENPVEVVNRNEVEAHGAGRRNGMLPTRNVLHDHVISVDAHKPVDATDEHHQKEI